MLAVMWLVIASLVFYSFDDPYRLLPLILSSITFNFFIGRMLLRSQNRALLAIGIGGDLLLLGYFKYAGFLVETLNAVTGIVLQKPNIDLPIGISFFTFTQIAFLVDAYRGEARAFELRRKEICRDDDCSRDQNDNDAHLQGESRETV